MKQLKKEQIPILDIFKLGLKASAEEPSFEDFESTGKEFYENLRKCGFVYLKGMDFSQPNSLLWMNWKERSPWLKVMESQHKKSKDFSPQQNRFSI